MIRITLVRNEVQAIQKIAYIYQQILTRKLKLIYYKGVDFLQKIGKQTIKFDNPPTILECASIVGPKESKGPLAKYFDQTLEDEFWGEKTWEKAESKIIKETVNTVIHKSGISSDKIDCCFAGDLLNQCISSSFGLREINLPFFGVLALVLLLLSLCV